MTTNTNPPTAPIPAVGEVWITAGRPVEITRAYGGWAVVVDVETDAKKLVPFTDLHL
jgi:SH3-like domain-containing protein